MRDKLDEIKFKEPFVQENGILEVHLIIPETKTPVLYRSNKMLNHILNTY
jgi:hypothetical protein